MNTEERNLKAMISLALNPLEILGNPLQDLRRFTLTEARNEPFAWVGVALAQIARLAGRQNIRRHCAGVWFAQIVFWSKWYVVFLLERIAQIKQTRRIFAVRASAVKVRDAATPIVNTEIVRQSALTSITTVNTQ